MSRMLIAAVFSLLVAGSAAAWEEPLPFPVSPGGAGELLEISQSCPTFSWGADPGAQSYELAVYQLSELERAASEGEEDVVPIVRATLPGNVNTWTPSLDRCLEAGGEYAWYLVAVDKAGERRLGPGRFFAVQGAPTAEDVASALDVLERYLAGSPSAAPPAEVIGEASAEADAAVAAVQRPEEGSSLGGADVLPVASIAAGAAGLRSEMPETTGVTYGVLGVSHSPAGAGLAADNTAGGADLLLGGGNVTLAMTELALDVASSSPQTFNVKNSQGAMELQVNGEPVLTTASGLDADLFGGLDETAFFRLDHNEVVTGRPAFNGGTEGVNSPFTVDSEEVVANLNADRVDGLEASSFLRGDTTSSVKSGILIIEPSARLGIQGGSAVGPGLYVGSSRTGLFASSGNDLAITVDGNVAARFIAPGFLDLSNPSLLFQGAEYLQFHPLKQHFELSRGLEVQNGTLQIGATVGVTVPYNRIGLDSAQTLSTDRDLLVSNDLEVGGEAHLSGVLNMNTGNEGQQSIHFFEDGSTTGETIAWSDVFDAFQFTDDIQFPQGTTITVTADNNLNLRTFGAQMIFATDADNDETVSNVYRWHNDGVGLNNRVMELAANGTLRIAGSLVENSAFDLAEAFLAGEELGPGDLVRVDPERHNAVLLASRDHGNALLGAVSSDPGLVLGGGAFSLEALRETWGDEVAARFEEERAALEEEVLATSAWLQKLRTAAADPRPPEDDRSQAERLEELRSELEEAALILFFERSFAPVALAGRVPVNVDGSFGEIEVGDYLTASPIPGVAMKATEAGPIVGTALEGFAEGRGRVLAYVHHGWYGGREPSTVGSGDEVRLKQGRMAELEGRIDELEQQVRRLATDGPR